VPTSLVDIQREGDSKSAFEDLQGGSGGDTLVVTPSANLDDYDPVGLSTAARLGINASASITLSGLAGGTDGRSITISNRATDYLLIIEHQSTGSATAANRFDLPNAFPLMLMPGDRATFTYSTTSSCWQLKSASFNVSQMGLTEFSDFVSGVSPGNGGSLGPFGVSTGGTGASCQPSTYLVNTTEKPLGVQQIDTGTTATGRATIGSAGTDQIVRGAGPALSISRLAAEALPTATETFALWAGFADIAAGTVTDVVAWELRWNGSAAEWSQTRASNAAASRDAAGSPSPDTNYIWLGVFINANWTRADFFYSTDSINWTFAGSRTTGIPAAGRNTGFCAASIIKSVGTTQRNASIDLAGYRVDYARG
jgi:hypothetical protein